MAEAGSPGQRQRCWRVERVGGRHSARSPCGEVIGHELSAHLLRVTDAGLSPMYRTVTGSSAATSFTSLRMRRLFSKTSREQRGSGRTAPYAYRASLRGRPTPVGLCGRRLTAPPTLLGCRGQLAAPWTPTETTAEGRCDIAGASVLLGFLALPLVYVGGPTLLFLSLPLACLAAVFGAIAVSQRRSLGYAGLVLGVLALALPFLQVFVLSD